MRWKFCAQSLNSRNTCTVRAEEDAALKDGVELVLDNEVKTGLSLVCIRNESIVQKFALDSASGRYVHV